MHNRSGFLALLILALVTLGMAGSVQTQLPAEINDLRYHQHPDFSAWY